MKEHLLHLERQIQEALPLVEKIPACTSAKKPSKILFYGMGGSAVGGDILGALVSKTSQALFTVFRSRDLSFAADENTLLIFSSYSGNTEETLNAARSANPTSQALVLTSGGELEKLARKNNWPLFLIPSGIPPRFAIGYSTFGLLAAMQKWNLLDLHREDIDETLSFIRSMPTPEVKDWSRRLAGKHIHLYGFSGFLEPVILRWKAQLAENSKILAAHHLLPEILHNEIEAWPALENASSHAAIFFKDASDPVSYNKKIEAARKLISQTGAEVISIESRGRSLLARLFYLISLGDWISYELALARKVDPLDIKTIEGLKKV